MKVLTSNPVLVTRSKVRKLDFMSSIDGKNTNQVKAFQDWLDAKGLKWVKATNSQRNNGSLLKKGAGYGSYGGSTQNAYKVYGAEWEKSVVGGVTPIKPPTNPVANVPVATENTTPPTPTEVPPTTNNVVEMKKKGFNWDKAKGVWSKAKDLGVVDKLGNLFGLNMNKPTDESPTVDPNAPTGDPSGEKPKMGKGLKIGLIVGGVLLLGTIVYFATRSKGAKVKTA